MTKEKTETVNAYFERSTSHIAPRYKIHRKNMDVELRPMGSIVGLANRLFTISNNYLSVDVINQLPKGVLDFEINLNSITHRRPLNENEVNELYSELVKLIPNY